MKLPEKNIPIAIKEVIGICEAFGLVRQIEIIEKDPPAGFFCFDGASGCPDWLSERIDLAALLHDIKYWLGGTEEERLIADYEFGIDVIRLCDRSAEESKMMFEAVRVGGVAWLPTPWKWGFGR